MSVLMMDERKQHTAQDVAARERLRATVRGVVQGVGFRPFVFRLAEELGLAGWVSNTGQGVLLEVEGASGVLDVFVSRLAGEKPPRSSILSLEASRLDVVGYEGFEIRESDGAGGRTVLVLPDCAPCAECLREMLDASDRRYRYPFTNCTHCGPRYSIMESLPYDRPNTTMRGFEMCGACRSEYENPRDRRFHAQPVCCPECGPQLALWDAEGRVVASRGEALAGAVEALREGRIVALKGVGGFQLLVDARNEEAVARLRDRKHREEKPFALLMGSVERVKEHCVVSGAEKRLLESPEAPIVLLLGRMVAGVGGVRGGGCCGMGGGKGRRLAAGVAPGNPYLGVMLAASPLHALLTLELDFPLVCTSGNLSDEPICTDERDALSRLGGIADVYLVHDRPIARAVDDSVARVVAGREQVMRRARGYAPLPVTLREEMPALLGVGAHLKNSVAIASGRHVFVSQHVGDLETAESRCAFERTIASLSKLYEFSPALAACDLHPDYVSTQHAEGLGVGVVRVQHHAAHVYSCMAENELDGPVLGVAWDGTGLGTDGTIWGGEFLRVGGLREAGAGLDWRRVCHFRTFALAGGDAASREPRRAALGVLHEMYGDGVWEMEDLAPLRTFGEVERRVVRRMLEGGIQSPRTSSAGRLFDAASSLMGLRQECRFEGQAAMALEFAAMECPEELGSYPILLAPVVGGGGPPMGGTRRWTRREGCGG